MNSTKSSLKYLHITTMEPCYSKVLIDGKYLTDNLYSSVMGEPTRPEEQLIHRIINRYSATHVKLTQVIKETPKLTPFNKVVGQLHG